MSATISPVPQEVINVHPEWAGKSMLTIAGANVKQFWQVKANDPASGLVGAYVSTTAAGVNIPAGTNLLAAIDSEQPGVRTQ